MTDAKQTTETSSEFAGRADEAKIGLLREFAGFLAHNKKWWLLPIILVLVLVGALLVAGGGAALPFIYTLF